MDTTLIYYTDNQLEEPISSLCVRYLKKTAGKIPIVSVSQEPMDLGLNVCVGKKKRNWINIYEQLLLGAKTAETKYVCTVEHDCLYTKEHFSWVPLSDDTFYYNENCWFVQWGGNHPELNGMYSQWHTQRLALSQLICNRELLVECFESRLALLDKDRKLVRKIVFAGEPGLSEMRIEKADMWAKSGRPVYLKQYMKEQLDKEKYGTFKTKQPNLDIRHGSNFTGPRRGRKRTYSIEPWGRFEDLIADNECLVHATTN